MPTAHIPRPEHPKPQFQRQQWLNLNGDWTYTFDHGKSGHLVGRELQHSQGFADTIRVPFCPESALSGVGHTDFIECMWYHRTLTVPADWAGQCVLLHFGGVDYVAELFIDGERVGRHFGGSASFHLDITAQVQPGATQHLVLRVLDDVRTGGQTSGKQSQKFKSAACHYTRVTGIWQTVWLEAVHPAGLHELQILPDLDAGAFHLLPRFRHYAGARRFLATLHDGAATVASAEGPCTDGLPLTLRLDAPKAWSPASPHLYDLTLSVIGPDGAVLDTVASYAGLRKVHIDGDQVYLNNEPLYQRLVLDQGFYPDGIWTAPSDAALRRDIELAMAAGFNGARLHQKVFEERFHYWADRLGYLTWGESASWGCDPCKILDSRNFLSEWAEVVRRDRNHPSIIAWTPFNETHWVSDQAQHHRTHIDAYELTKALDPTRPVNDASGYIHVRTDLWTIHQYERPDALMALMQPAPDASPDGVHHRWPEHEARYTGQPYLIDEFGGLKWIPPTRRANADNSWGYGDDIPTLDDFYRILEDEVALILAVPNMSGYCYTQLTDVEQEENGIYNYDRTPKFDIPRIAAIFRRHPPRFSPT